MAVVEQKQRFQNDAFILFCEDDQAFAEQLEKVLKRYRPPSGLGLSSEHLHIFRDEPELAGSDYYSAIEKQFERARKLVVVCSPAARKDPHLNRQILRFVEMHGKENVVPLLISGVPNHVVRQQQSQEAAFPEALYRIAENPTAIDYSGFEAGQHKFHKGAYESGWYTLLASICDVQRIDLAQRERDRAFAIRRKRLLVVFSACLLAAIVSGVWFWHYQREHAERERTRLTRMATQLLDRSEHAAEEQQINAALHYLAAAIGLAPTPELRSRLMNAAHRHEPVLRLGGIFRHENGIGGALFLENAGQILTWGDDGAIRCWDQTTGRALDRVMRHDGPVYGAILSHDGTRLLSWSEDQTARLWQLPSGMPIGEPLMHESGLIAAAFNRDETRIITHSKDFTTRIWDAANGQSLGNPSRHDGWINGAVFSRDERYYLTWSDDSTARRWYTSSGQPAGPALRHHGEVNGAMLSADEKRIVTWGNDGMIRFWDTASGRPDGPPLLHDGAVTGACFNHDETLLLSWGRDQTARLWDVATHSLRVPPFHHDGWVFGASFNTTESQILTWSYDNTARIWDITRSSEAEKIFRHSTGPAGSDAGIFGAAWDQSERRLLTWGDDNTARIWDVTTGQQSGASLQHDLAWGENCEIVGAIYNDDLTRILTWSSDSTARYWETPGYSSGVSSGTESADLDFPADLYQLQIMALTGTRLDTIKHMVRSLEVATWDSLRSRYNRAAHAHSDNCRYPGQNLWRHFSETTVK